MKKTILSLIIVLITMTSCTQNGSEQQSNSNAIYRLFPTQNMWTFIKLNTRNGQMWQVQYDVKDSNRFETILNSESQTTRETEVNDRFTLCPTQNMYTFLLLDQFDGRTWQVQWSTEAKNRFIIPIAKE